MDIDLVEKGGVVDIVADPDPHILCPVIHTATSTKAFFRNDHSHFGDEYKFSSVCHAQHSTRALLWQMRKDLVIQPNINGEEQAQRYR